MNRSRSWNGSDSLKKSLASRAKNCPAPGQADRSHGARRSSLRRLVRDQTATDPLESNELLGISSTIPRTFLSPKKSLPLKLRSFSKPEIGYPACASATPRPTTTSAKKGSLRRPAKNRYSPDVVTTASVPVDTGAFSTMTSPCASGRRASPPVARYTVAVWGAPCSWENTTLYAISASASPSVSTLKRYTPSGSNCTSDPDVIGSTSRIITDFEGSPGLRKM